MNKGQQALALVERYIKRQPQALEAYELLAKVLTALKRENEITPRLEEAARRDSKNVPLQYVLADRYRETGQVEKADALYKSLLTSQPTPQTYRALAASLLKRKKAGDLLKVICEAAGRPNGLEAISPQLQAAAADDALAEAMLDAGIAAAPGQAPDASQVGLLSSSSFIANPERGADKTGAARAADQAAAAAPGAEPQPPDLSRDRRHAAAHGAERRGGGDARADDGEVSRARRTRRLLSACWRNSIAGPATPRPP